MVSTRSGHSGKNQKRRNKMKKQEIAIYIANINWQNIQNDVPLDNVNLIYIREEIEKLSKEDAIDLLLCVMEAKELANISPKFYGDMIKFESLNK